jgi:hypothetical protein
MVPSKVEIHAVVEVAIRRDRMWVPLPPEPWPNFVRLSRSTSLDDVALVMGVISSYGRKGDGAASSMAELLADFPCILPGGLAVGSGARQVLPSCCSGLEHWSEWKRVVPEGLSPWTGHDPAPLVEVADDEVRIWSDGAMGEKPTDEVPIVFTLQDFENALVNVEDDLEEFLEPLGTWLGTHASSEANAFVERFRAAFMK